MAFSPTRRLLASAGMDGHHQALALIVLWQAGWHDDEW
jgi:hypothetical protein